MRYDNFMGERNVRVLLTLGAPPEISDYDALDAVRLTFAQHVRCELLPTDLAELRTDLAAMTVRAERAEAAVLDIDAHAAPIGSDDEGFNSGGYIISVGSLHRALGVVGHGAAKRRDHAVSLDYAHGAKCEGCKSVWKAVRVVLAARTGTVARRS